MQRLYPIMEWTMSTPELRDAAMTSKAWPFEEARKLVARMSARPMPEPDQQAVRLTGSREA